MSYPCLCVQNAQCLRTPQPLHTALSHHEGTGGFKRPMAGPQDPLWAGVCHRLSLSNCHCEHLWLWIWAASLPPGPSQSPADSPSSDGC